MQSTAIRTVADSLPGNEIIKSQVVLSRIFGHTNNDKLQKIYNENDHLIRNDGKCRLPELHP